MKLSVAIPIGYHKPESGVDPAKLAISVATNGTRPPKTPLPTW